MAEIDEIIARVNALPTDGGALVLSAAKLATPATDAFFKQVVQAPQLRLDGATRTPGQGSIAVSGTADLLSYKGLGVDLTFSTDDNGIVCTLEGTFAGNHALPLVTWIRLRRAGLSVTLSQPFNIVHFGFLADLAISDANPHVIPIRITEVNPSTWQFGLAKDIEHPVTVDEVVALLSGNVLTGFLPQPLVQALSNLAVTDLSATLDFKAKQAVDFSVGLTVTNGWPDIIPGFGLAPGLQLILAMSNPTDPASRRTVGIVRGTLQIGKTDVPVFAQVAVASAEPTSWLIGLDQDPGKYASGKVGVTLPTIADLFSLVSDSAAASLPEGLRKLPAIAITKFQVGFTTSPAQLQTLAFAAGTVSSWSVIDGFLVVENLMLSLDVIRPPGRDKLQIGGLVGGTFAVSDVAVVYLEVAKDRASDDWTLTGALAPSHSFNLTDFVAKLLSRFVTIPSNAPQIVFDMVSTTVVPGKSFDLTAGSNTPWQLLSKLSIDTFSLRIGYQAGTPKGVFTGSLRAQITVANVTLLLSTELGANGAGGWKFAGSTAPGTPIKIGDFIRDLARQSSTQAEQALPDFIASLEIERLSLSYDTVTKDFSFECETRFSASGKPLDLILEIALRKQDTGYTQLYGGTLSIGELRFELYFEKITRGDGQTSSMFLAAVQPGVSVDLRALVAQIDDSAGAAMPALTVALENALFLYRKKGSDPATYLFGLALGVDLDLSSLPLVGSMFQGSKLGGIKDIQAVYVSAPVDADDLDTFNGLLTQADAKPPLPRKEGATGSTPVLSKGFNFAANIDLGGNPIQLTAGGNAAPPNALPAPQTAGPPTPPSGNASWFDIKKSIGPVSLQRIGVRYEDGRAWLLLDADFLLAGLSLGLQGLAVGLKLDDLKNVSFNLDGLSLDFTAGPLTIAGGFLRIADDYIGEARVKAAQFGLTAIGGYAPKEKSFFIFVRLNAPLGGPPFFFITGVAGGFGINRSLTLPPIDDLTKFALLPANNKFPATLDAKDPGGSLASTLAATQKFLMPQAGVNWVAAGLDVTSFEMVDTSALVTVSFGVDFELALLGISRITVPKLAPNPIVYLEIALLARFKPSEGLFAVDGRLTPASFLYARLVEITGGFAFYIWFAGPHAGDFVISVGGYHPRFKKPDNYPTVPRLQLVYKLGSLVMKGQAYLALTPHMVMAGLQIDATWESGSLKAWFSAGIDFLLGWRPFHYEADAFVHIGVSVTLDLLVTSVTITIHVGVDLNIWGPPLGGRATIDLDIVSFTIYFGADQHRDSVDWDGFKSSFLPAGTDQSAAPPHQALLAAGVTAAATAAGVDGLLCTASVTDGLIKELRAKDPQAFFSWIVDTNQFTLQSSTLIPAKQATYNSFALQTPFTKAAGFKPGKGTPPVPHYDERQYPTGISWTDQFGVLPMGLGADGFSSELTVTLKRAREGTDYTVADNYVDDVNEIAVQPLVKSATSAMWAASDPGLNGKRLVPDTLVGLSLSPMPQHPDITLKADLWAMLFNQAHQIVWYTTPPAIDRSDDFQTKIDGPRLTFMLGERTLTCQDYKLTALTDDAAADARDAMVDSLNGLGFAFDKSKIDVADLAQYPLWDWPMIRKLGEERASS